MVPPRNNEEGHFTCGKVCCHVITVEYLASVLVPVVWVILTHLLKCWLEVLMKYFQFSITLGMVWGGKDTIDA